MHTNALGGQDTVNGYNLAGGAVAFKSNPVMRCPDEPPTLDEAGSLYYSSTTGDRFNNQKANNYQTSYGINFTVSYYTNRPRKGWSLGPNNVLYSPSDARIVSHAEPYSSYYINIDSAYTNPRIAYTFTHVGESTNLLYMDGHVDTRQHVFASGSALWQYIWQGDPP